MRFRAAAPALACAAVVAGCGSSSTTRVPDVRFTSFPTALATLNSAGLIVRVPYFPPLDTGVPSARTDLLGSYRVVLQQPSVGSAVARGTTVTLLVTPPRFEGPMGSLRLPPNHPATTTIPKLVGLRYTSFFSNASAFSGLWGRLGYVAPVDRLRSLEQFRIGHQSRIAGTVVPYLGMHRRSIRPGEATVTVDLGNRRTAIEVDRLARRALREALASPAGHVWSAVTQGFPGTTGPMSYRCYVGRRTGGYCLVAVDPSARHPLVVFVVMWHDWHGPRAARKVLHTRTWRVHVE